MSELFTFQEDGVQRLMREKRLILNDEVGVGKTVQAIEFARREQIPRILWVTKSRLRWNAAIAIQQWYDIAPVTVVRGSDEQKLQLINSFGVGFLVVPYECIRQWSDDVKVRLKQDNKYVPPDFLRAIRQHNFDLVVIDEAHNFCNRKAMQTRGAFLLAKDSPRLALLTGTSVRGRGSEVWPLLHMIDPKRYSSYWNFAKKHFAAKRGFYGWEVLDAPVDYDAFCRELSKHVLRRELADVAPHIPNIVRKPVYLQLEEDQKRIYREMEEEMIAELGPGDYLAAPALLAQIVRLKQIAVSPRLLRPDIEVGAKIEVLMDLLRGTDQKVLVFSQFAKAIELVLKECSREGIGAVSILGTSYMSAEKQLDHEREFRENPHVRVLAATMQAAGEGLDLVASSLLVRLDRHLSPIVNDQTLGRFRRHGQEAKGLVVIDYIMQDTIEEWVEEKLDVKQDIARQINERIKERYALHHLPS